MASAEDKGLGSKVYIGTMGWSYRFWISNFYSASAKPNEFLKEYSRHFSTVEVNSTFYRFPYGSTIKKWNDQTPEHFRFSLKFPRAITHEKMLKDCTEYAKSFMARVAPLGEKLGVMLLQFPPEFGSQHLHLLNDFLEDLPKENRFAVEVRNKNLLDEKLYSILRENEVALALVDSSIMPSIETLTTDFTYIRLEGDREKVNGNLGRVEIDRAEDIVTWANKIRSFSDRVARIYVYFSKYYSGHPPTDATKLSELLHARNNPANGV
ncbi:MAG: DUF72 domain-containing protein [archaeon]